jgi:hypothetical protein
MRTLLRFVRRSLLLLAFASAAESHIASNSFLSLSVDEEQISGVLEISIRDAELAVGIDENADSKITWRELRDAEPAIASYVAQHLTLTTAGRICPLSVDDLQVNHRVDGNYAWLAIHWVCPQSIRSIGLRYELLQGIDPSHRGLLTLQNEGLTQTAVLRATAEPILLDVQSSSSAMVFREYLQAGVEHILSGIDHLLFLISLLLPAALLRQDRQWQPVTGVGPALKNIVAVVTAFTLAHSITLSLAAFNVIRLPSRLTESVIAASIAIAALNNIFPLVTESRARIAFAFGLLHGFGFASVLSEMGLPSGARVLSLFAFNLGIEVGQLAVVAMVMPLIYACRSTRIYRTSLMPWGSAAIVVVALVWLVQRAALASS